jgi:hypothetical protein
MSQFLGVEAGIWFNIAAIITPLFWWFIWRWKGHVWFKKIYYKFFEKTDEHREVLELQAKYFGRLFNYLIWIGIVLLELNMLGIIGGGTTASRNVYIAGGTISAAVLLGGSAYLSFLIAGVRLLLERGFGVGNYIKLTHGHRDTFSGWVQEIGLFKTIIRAYPHFGIHPVRNSLLLEYRPDNLDAGPFYHEIFEFEVPKGKKEFIIGAPQKLHPTTKEVLSEGSPPMILQRLKEDLSGFLIQTDINDRKEFSKVFKNMDDNTWAWLSQPSVMLEGDRAILRIPVRNFFDGIILRHQISAKNILEVN